MTTYTINSVTNKLHRKLQEYLEARYPISEESLLLERRTLLEQKNIISKEPYIEVTPVYEAGNEYKNMNIPSHCRNAMTVFSEMNPGVGVFPKPYVHQQVALESFLVQNNDLIVATGTGSGKTESFLHPILNSFLDEGIKRPKQFQKHAVRALILYPMNALVSDQITRLRRLFGDDRIKDYFQEECGRHPLFGMYTSRTPYPGERSQRKDKYQLADIIKYYNDIEENNPELAIEMKKRGKWIAKDLRSFSSGKRGAWQSKFNTSEYDAELFTRDEIQTIPPDILVTNYSMLEYMLMRPIERSIWRETKQWLSEDKNNTFILVLDEAHMYRGTSGAEVALLIRRLQARLGIGRDRLKCILTSASLGSEEDTIAFAKDLTGECESRTYKLITGTKEIRPEGRKGTLDEANIFAEIDSELFTNRINDYDKLKEHLNSILPKLGFSQIPNDLMNLPNYLYDMLNGFGPLENVIQSISGKAQKFAVIAQQLFPDADKNVAQKAVSNMLMLANAAKKGERVLLPVRVHLFFKGISGIYVCTNKNCNVKHNNQQSCLGKMYDSLKLKCSCKEQARVYELLTHRKCGTAYLRGYVSPTNEDFLWNEKGSGILGEKLTEIHLLVEEPHSKVYSGENIPTPVWLDVQTGYLTTKQPVDTHRYLKLYKPSPNKKKIKKQKAKIITFSQCPCCMKSIKNSISDLRTKGEQPFANLVREQFHLQTPTTNDKRLPNEGKKVLLFSDGRQKAARLARDIPNEVELDSFRQTIIYAANLLEEEGLEAKLSNSLYIAVLQTMSENNLYFFDGNDREMLMKHVQIFKEDFDADDYDYNQLIEDEDVKIIKQFKYELIRQLCHPLYSIYSTTTAFIEPMKKVMKNINKALKDILSEIEVTELVQIFIQELLDKVAIDAELNSYERVKIRGFSESSWGVEKHFVSKHFRKIINLYVENEDESNQIIKALFKLCVEYESAWYLSVAKLKLVPAINHEWYKCKDCKELNMVKAKGLCVNCFSDNLEVLSPTSSILNSEKGFWRTPIENVLRDKMKISNITVEEHTAQLSQKDPKIAIATTEEYELRFQDIILNELDGPVDMLSCTTTMEVGVDIGSLTAVGLRNVPPQRENYQQRAGRAGRRGSALSTVLTYSQGGPHDFYYFNHPERIISGPSRDPIIYIDNFKIAKRHINAYLIQTYFHENVIGSSSSVLNTSLGDTLSFFEGPRPFNYAAFSEWLHANQGTKFLKYPTIFEILPDEVILNHYKEKQGENISRLKLVMLSEIGKSLVEELRNNYEDIRESLSKTDDDQQEVNPNDKFLDFLFNHGFLPTYAFPKDLSSFYIEEYDPTLKKVIVKQRPQLEINRALSEFAPGRQIVVDKKTYRVGGIFVPNPKSRSKPGQDLMIDQLPTVTYCEKCLFVSLDKYDAHSCPVCNAELKKMPFLRPTGFSPEKGSEVIEGDRDQEFTYAVPPQLPIPSTAENLPFKAYQGSKHFQYVNTMDEKLIVMNRGIESTEGFDICSDCGAIWTAGEEKGPHSVPYKIKKEYGQKDRHCNGSIRRVFLGNVFNTDLLLLRFTFGKEIDFNPNNAWLHDALKTIGEALVLAVSRVLDIDYNELSAGYRLLPKEMNRSSTEYGGADVYLFDTLSGGAGYAILAGKVFHEVIEETLKILGHCENDCETSCYKCLRHYANQFYHNQLNRFVALELLTYAKNGELKHFSSEEQKKILTPLKRMLEIREEKFVEVEQEGKYYLKLEEKIRLIGVKNNIQSLDSMDDSNVVRYFSSYEIMHDLPNVYESL